MSASSGPQPIPDGLTFAVDAASPKSYSQNIFPYALDIGAWATSGNAGTYSRDVTVTDSPAGGIPLKVIQTGNDPYTSTYNSSIWNLGPALVDQTWTVSVWVKASVNTTVEGPVIFGANSGGAYVTAVSAGSINVYTYWTRVSYTTTFTAATTAYIQVRLDGTSTYASTINVWWDGLQVERNSAMTRFNSVANISGTSWNDVGGKNSVTLAAFPTYSTANNGSILFNGTTQSASVATGVGSMGTGNWTISCWWKSNGAQSSYVTIIGQGFTGSTSNGSWAFKVSHGSGDFNFTYCTPGIVDNLSTNNPNDDIWHNLVAIRSGTSLILYKDGVSVKSITLPGGQTFGTGAITYIGYNPRDNAYLKGYLANLTIHNVAWTTAQLTANFNAQRTRYGI